MSCFLQHKESLKNVLSDLTNLKITTETREVIDQGRLNSYENKLKTISAKLGFNFETFFERKEETVSKFAGRDPKKTRGNEQINVIRLTPIHSIFLQIDEARKKLGIYDTKETTNSFFKRMEAAKENNGQISMAFQLNGPAKLGPAIKELDTHLLDFISQFGVRSEQLNDFKSRFGVDALGATDVLNKLIWYKTNRNEETIPEEVGHMAVMLMGEKDPIVKTLLKNITSWSEYEEVREKYLPIYKNEKQVKIEAIGKLIAKALVKNYKDHGLDHSIIQKIILKIEEIIRKIVQSTGIGKAAVLNEHIADHIALNILMGNKSYISDLVTGTKQLNYERAMMENPFIANTITLFTSKGARLSGSLSLAAQEMNVYREKIKDLDFRIDSVDEYNDLEETLKKIGAVPKHYGWSSKTKAYVTFAYVIPKPGHRIEVIKRDKYRGNGYLESYKVYNQYGNEVDKNVGAVEVDLFVSKYPVSGNNKIFTPWEDIMAGKLSLSPLGDHERMFQRDKDQKDYVLMKPNGYTKSHSAFMYYQVNEEPENPIKPAVDIDTSDIQLGQPKFNPDNYEASSYPIRINGKYAGTISVDQKGRLSSSLGMAAVELDKEFQGKGYGTKVYIALAKELAKQGKTLKSEAFGKDLINESANRVWKSLINKSLAQDKGKYYELDFTQKQTNIKPVDKLDSELINGFLADFGITATEYNSMKDDLGINSYTASDMITKAIAYQKGESILPEVAYFAYSMLGKQNNKMISELRYLIGNWKGYRARFNYHKEVIYQKRGIIPETKEWRQTINDLCILDFIKENIEDYYKNPKKFDKIRDTKWTKEDFTLWRKLIKFIEDLLDSLSNYAYRRQEKKTQLANIGASIADDILTRNYTYYDYSLSADAVLKDYTESINSDPFAKKIVEIGQSLKLVLTGSLALRRAGSVYRTVAESIHDIDWVIPFGRSVSNNDDIAVYNKIILSQRKAQANIKNATSKSSIESIKEANQKEVTEIVKEFSWFKEFSKEFPTFKVTNGFYGSEHIDFESITVQGVIDGQFYESDGKHQKTVEYYTKDPVTKAPVKQSREVTVKHKKGDLIEGTGYAIDFFVRLNDTQEEHENYFKLWKEISIAKLKMGRDKDFRDWKAFMPFIQSQGAYNFNYAGFRHFNYESSQSDMLEDTQGYKIKQKTINNKYYFDNQENLHNFEDDSQSNFFC